MSILKKTRQTHSPNSQCKQAYIIFPLQNKYWDEFVEYLNTHIFKEVASKKKVWQLFYVGAFDFICLWLINVIISFLSLNTEDGFDMCKHESCGPGVSYVVDPDDSEFLPSHTSLHCVSLFLCPNNISCGTSYWAKCLLFSLQDKVLNFDALAFIILLMVSLS